MSRYDNTKVESSNRPVKGNSRVFELIEDLEKALTTYSILESKLDNNIDRIGYPNPTDSMGKECEAKAPNTVIEKLEYSLNTVHKINSRFEANLVRLEQYV